MRLPSRAGQAEHLGPRFYPPLLVLVGRGSTWLQQHSRDQPRSRLHTEVINGESTLAAMEENTCCSRCHAEELASNRRMAHTLLMRVLVLAQLD